MFPVSLAAATLNRPAAASTSSNYTCHQRRRIISPPTASSTAANWVAAGANPTTSFPASDSGSFPSDVDEVNELWQVVEYAEPAIRLVEVLFGKGQSSASSPLPPPTPQPSSASLLSSSSSSSEEVVDLQATQTSLAPPATTVARNTPEMNDSLFFAQMDLGAFAVGPVEYNDIGEQQNGQNTPVSSTSPQSRRIPSPTAPPGGGGSGGIINFLFRRGGGGGGATSGRRASVQLPAQPVPQPSEQQQQKRPGPGWFSKRRASVDDGSSTTSGCSSMSSSSNPLQTNSSAATAAGSLSPSPNHNATVRSAVVSPSNGVRVQNGATDNVANGHLPKSSGRPDTLAAGDYVAASGPLGPAVPPIQIAPRNIDRRAYASRSVVPPPNLRHQAAVEAATSRTSVKGALPANRARHRWQSAEEKSSKGGTPSYRVQYQLHRSPPARTPSNQTTMSQLLVTSNSRPPPSTVASPIGPDEFLKMFRSRAYSADCRADASLAATLAKVRQQRRQRSSNSMSNSLDGSDLASAMDSDLPSSSASEMSIAVDMTSPNEVATHSSSRRSSVDVGAATAKPTAASTSSPSEPEPVSAPPESSAVPGEVSGGVDSAVLASRLLKLSLTTQADVPDTIPEHIEVHHLRRGSLYSNVEESELRTARSRRQAIMAAASGAESRSRRFSDPLRPNPNNMATEMTLKLASSESTKNGSVSRIMRNFPKCFTNTTDTKHVRGIDLSLQKRHLVIWRDRRTGTKIITLSETTDTVAGNSSSRRFTTDKNLAFVNLLQSHSCYDLMPKHAYVVSFDVKLELFCAFDALIFHGKKSALLWDSAAFRYIGMLTITDFIRILHQSYFHCRDELNRLDQHNIERWRELLSDDLKDLVTISADRSVYDAVHLLRNNNIRRLLVYDEESDTEALYVLTKKRILFFIHVMMPEKNFPDFAHQSIGELDVGTYNDMASITMETTVIDALSLFIERGVSALPVVDENGRLVNAFAKYDTINLVSNQMYKNLDNTVRQVLSADDAVTEGVYVCRKTDSLADVIRWLVNKEIHRLWVVGDGNQLEGVVSLSDVVHYIVIRQASAVNEDSLSQDLRADDGVSNQTETTDTASTTTNNNNHDNDDDANDPVKDDGVDEVEIDLQMANWSAAVEQQTASADDLPSVPTSPESGFPSTVESSTGDLPAERQLLPPLVGTEWSDIDAVVCDVGTIWPPASPGEAITGDHCRHPTRPVVDNGQFLSTEGTTTSFTSSSSVKTTTTTHSCELFNEVSSEMDDTNAPEPVINKPLSSSPGSKSDRVQGQGQATDRTTSGRSVTPRIMLLSTSDTELEFDLEDDSAYTSSNGLYNGDDAEWR